MLFTPRVLCLIFMAAAFAPNLAFARNCPLLCTGCPIDPINEFNFILDNETGSGWLGFIPDTGDPDWAYAADITMGWGARTAGGMSGFTERPPRICGQSSSSAYVQVSHQGPATTCVVTFEVDWVASFFRTVGSGANGAYGGTAQSGTVISDETIGINPVFRLTTAEYSFEVSDTQSEIEALVVTSFTQSELVPTPIGLHVQRSQNDVGFPRQTGGFECGSVRISDRHANPLARSVGDVELPFELREGFSISTTGRGRIHGSVRAAASNLPIIYGQVELLDATGQVLDTQQLPTGNFDFTDLEPGSYYVRTVDTEFLNQEAGGAECETVQCVLTSGTPIVVTDGGSENVPFLLGGLGPLFRNSFEDVDFVNWHSNYLSAP